MFTRGKVTREPDVDAIWVTIPAAPPPSPPHHYYHHPDIWGQYSFFMALLT